MQLSLYHNRSMQPDTLRCERLNCTAAENALYANKEVCVSEISYHPHSVRRRYVLPLLVRLLHPFTVDS